MAEAKKKINPLASVGGILGGLGGWSLSEYAGPTLWIPGIALILLIVIFARTPLRPPFFMGAISVTGAQIIWFIIGGAITGRWSAVALDIILLTAGIIWLWLRPGLASMLYLGIVQLLSLAVNVTLLISATVGSTAHKALTVHCVFRLLAIICLVTGYRKLRQASSGPGPATVISADEPNPPGA